MNHYAAWKNTLIVFFLFISTLYALPNLYGSDLAIQITGAGDYVVEDNDLETINNELLENNIAFKSLGFQDKNILIRFSDSQSQLSSKALLKEKLSRNYVIALNLAPSVPQWLEGSGVLANNSLDCASMSVGCAAVLGSIWFPAGSLTFSGPSQSLCLTVSCALGCGC